MVDVAAGVDARRVLRGALHRGPFSRGARVPAQVSRLSDWRCGTCWLAVVVVFFTICLNVDALPFDPWVTSTQKALIVSFAVWVGWLPWSRRDKA